MLTWRLNEDVRAAGQRAYEQARISEERFRASFEEAPIGMALCSIDGDSFGRFMQVNRSLCEITGYGEAELLDLDFVSITHPADRIGAQRESRAFIAEESPAYEVEKRYIHAKGHEIWVHVTASLVRDANDRPLYGIGQIQDITARKRAEHELEHQALHDPLTGLPNRSPVHGPARAGAGSPAAGRREGGRGDLHRPRRLQSGQRQHSVTAPATRS